MDIKVQCMAMQHLTLYTMPLSFPLPSSFTSCLLSTTANNRSAVSICTICVAPCTAIYLFSPLHTLLT